MNLQEQVSRIKTIMGLIKEDVDDACKLKNINLNTLESYWEDTTKTEQEKITEVENFVKPIFTEAKNYMLKYIESDWFNKKVQEKIGKGSKFNNNDLENCKTERREQYNKAVESVKNTTYKQLIAENDKIYDTKSCALIKSTPKYLSVPILKSPFEEIISMTNVVKLSNEVVINCFKKIHNKEDLTEVITLIVKHELSNSLNPVINSMELKILVTSIVYNAYIVNKVDSKLYKEMVHEKSVKIISDLFSEQNMTDFNTVLVQDINFIIENKKIIKLSYLKNVLIKLAIETFLLNL